MPFFVYITTNPARTVLYVGMTNDLHRRLKEHYEDRGNRKTFSGRYYCHKLIYYECYGAPYEAICREKEIRKWNRAKKEALIGTVNPEWDFLNHTDDFRVGRY